MASLSKKRLAFIEARKDIELSKRMWEAARTLGVVLVVIDNPGHWFEDELSPYSYYREAFLPVNIAVDSGLVDRIVHAVQSYSKHIDGLMTVSDARLFAVAQAAKRLGLPTSPPESYIIAADKYKTRVMEPNAGSSFQVGSVDELQSFLLHQSASLHYPLIVKPTLGWGSECVSCVSNVDELLSATSKASARHANATQASRTVVIEPYISGPEVDANFVLLDGEVLFWEVIDDFPCTADIANLSSTAASGSSANFLETQMMLPSKLPANEQHAIKTAIKASILHQGFRTGVFHCEARLRHSSASYTADKNGIVDLHVNTAPSTNERPVEIEDVWLLEINARPPGYMESAATAIVHRIDYFAIQMALALDAPTAIVHSLVNDPATLNSPINSDKTGSATATTGIASGTAIPSDTKAPLFAPTPSNLLVQFIPQPSPGRMLTPDPAASFLATRPDLARHVAEYKSYVKGGDRMVGPAGKELSWLAHFLIVGSERSECLRTGREIEQSFHWDMEEE
ncbi:MAG: hypothetical protein M1822_007339 [Bathelium mastoideum]|nr:MAG: hypothetical protein M1822_007339 [Bathelium mastoideum]